MHVGGVQQVMLEVRVAEINRLIAERIGVNFNALAPQGNFGVQPDQQPGRRQRPGRQFTGCRVLLDHLLYPGARPAPHGHGGLDRGRDPVDRLSGPAEAAESRPGAGGAQPGDHQRPKGLLPGGGEYPIPVPQSGVGGAATITIEYKKYGVQLEFTPTVLNESKIAVQVHPIVSELDTSLGVSFTLPEVMWCRPCASGRWTPTSR